MSSDWQARKMSDFCRAALAPRRAASCACLSRWSLLMMSTGFPTALSDEDGLRVGLICLAQRWRTIAYTANLVPSSRTTGLSFQPLAFSPAPAVPPHLSSWIAVQSPKHLGSLLCKWANMTRWGVTPSKSLQFRDFILITSQTGSYRPQVPNAAACFQRFMCLLLLVYFRPPCCFWFWRHLRFLVLLSSCTSLKTTF